MFWISIITFVPITYILSFSSILYFEGSFNDNNLKDNYNVKFLNIINKINTSLYLLETHILISFFVIVCFIFNNYYFDGQKLKEIKYYILLIINSIYYIYEILIIWKLYLSYKISKGSCPWFMICDYILISIILLYIIFMIYITYNYYKFSGSGIQIFKKTILTKYKNIIINEFALPTNFQNMSKLKKRNFLLNNANKFHYTHSERHIHLINIINEFRTNNNLQRFTYNEEEKIPYFFINDLSEIILFGYQKFFKLSDRKYLFKDIIGEFEKNINTKNSDVLNILFNKDINKISIIDTDDFEYILFSDELIDDCRINLIEAKNTNPNELDKDMYEEYIEDICYDE